ncbi:TPA: ANR family transcriptional regulator [Salmonella enterica subsp. enterica serovar Typhimurium]|uniref:ANR family transcriptional regulator n=1 Tax=Salmonella enterica I TaxID=59201 RepID=A0A612H7B7_SALET|nr:ANR family transcriptional regulator [Salmonella enterica subsp. enterica]EHJ3658413.1 ANR family transcriptional regulator [Salmonella enterica]HDO5799903.1 ANR family transcriptional regulator [Salmonella enterica subsp. enterica serovar Typhimurium]HED0202224.1 ANR family transcriptional regulator [Salmonella enterica subsp. enterica serovar Orientalis]
MRIKFIEITRQAADLERQRAFHQAGELWRKALVVARRDANAEYCRRRADFCLSSMFTRSSQVC